MKNVALIDDDEGPILYYEINLKRAGYNVIRIRNFAEALAFCNNPNPIPDFWVIDMMMSVGLKTTDAEGENLAEATNMGLASGLYLYKKIKGAFPVVPAILLTSIPSPDLLDGIESALTNNDTCEAKLDLLPQDLVFKIAERI